MAMTKQSFTGLQMPANPEELRQATLLNYGTSLSSTQPLSKEHQALMKEANIQILTIRFEGAKVIAVKDEVGKLHKQSATSMEGVVKHHFALHDAAEGKNYQGALDDYIKYDLTTCAQHHEQIMELGFHNIMHVMGKRLEPHVEPEVVTIVKERPPRGLIERFFGGGE